MRRRSIYIVGSLANSEIPLIANKLRAAGHYVFDDWCSPGDRADECWRDYEHARGRLYLQALNGHHARNAFEFDRHHLEKADTVILVMPCGRSGHMELGYVLGAAKALNNGNEGHILLPGEPERYDLMYRFAHSVWTDVGEMIDGLANEVRNVI